MPNAIDLFSPARLGGLSLKNRFVMAPMTRGRADDRHAPTAMNALYYAQRSGAGLIITEGTPPEPMGQGYIGVPGMYTPEQVEGWRGVVDAVHAQGALIFQQLMHVGRVSHPSFLDGAIPVGPSAVKVGEGKVFTKTGPQDFVTPRAFETSEVPDVIANYGRAAQLAKEAGFDGVEVHATSGYLPAQFLLPASNQRDDAWGGTLEKRARFLLETVDAVSQAQGAGRVGVRIGPAFTYNEAHDPDPKATWSYVLPELARRGIGYIHLKDAPADWDVTSFVRERWPGVLIANGGFDRERADAELASGRADLVSFGKLFLCNPDLPGRFARNAPLADADQSTYYVGGAKGYIDYPSLSEQAGTEL